MLLARDLQDLLAVASELRRADPLDAAEGRHGRRATIGDLDEECIRGDHVGRDAIGASGLDVRKE